MTPSALHRRPRDGGCLGIARDREMVEIGRDEGALVHDVAGGPAVVAALLEAVATGLEVGLVAVDVLVEQFDLRAHDPAFGVDEVARSAADAGLQREPQALGARERRGERPGAPELADDEDARMRCALGEHTEGGGEGRQE